VHGKTVSRTESAMVPLDKAVAISYKLSIVTMSPSAAVWPQSLFNVTFQAINGRISKTVKDTAKVTINHQQEVA